LRRDGERDLGGRPAAEIALAIAAQMTGALYR